MKKIIVGVVALGAVAFAGLSGLWFYGKQQIDQQIDGFIQANAVDYDFAYIDRSIAGYPLGYAVELSDVTITSKDRQFAMKTPWIKTSSGLTDIGVLKFKFAPAQEIVSLDNEGQEKLLFTILSDDMLLSVNPEGSYQETDLTAKSLRVSANEEIMIFDMTATDLDLKGTVNQQQTELDYQLKASMLDYTINVTMDQEQVSQDTSYRAEDVIVDIVYNVPERIDYNAIKPENPFEQFYDADIQMDFKTAKLFGESLMTLPDMDGLLRLETVSDISDATLEMKDGKLRIAGGGEGVTYELSMQGGLPAIGIEKVQFAIANMTVDYLIPFKPSEEPQDISLKFDLADFSMSEEGWSVFDADKAFNRDPAQMHMDVVISQSMPDGLMATQIQPQTPDNVLINNIMLDVAGAQVTAKGEFYTEEALPAGQADLTLSGSKRLIQSAVKAGLITAEDASSFAMFVGILFKPTDDENVLESAIVFQDGEPLVNGIPIAALLGQ